MTAHSIVPPSSSARRVQCSASTRAEAAYPEDAQGDEAREGEAAHWGVAEMLSGRAIDVGVIAPNGVTLTAAMVEGAEVMHDDVCRELAPHGLALPYGNVEQTMRLKRIHPQSFGTPDYRAWLPGWHLLVYDYKYGHRPVDVFENAQLVEYVSGALDEAAAHGVTDLQVKVTAKIVQPRVFNRAGPVQSWTFQASDIRALVNRASNAAHEALGPNPRAQVGPECRDCRARHACPSLHAAAAHACDIAAAPQPFDLPPAAMALEYRTLKRYEALMKARREGLEAQLLALAKRGASTPGLRLEHGQGRQRWAIPDADVIAVGKLFEVDLAKPPEALTPKQAVDAGLPEVTLLGITTTPRGAAVLVEDDGSLARKVFG